MHEEIIHEEVLKRLVQRIEQGTKTLASALLYAAEYDRLHGTNLAQRLQAHINGALEQQAQPRTRKRHKHQ